MKKKMYEVNHHYTNDILSHCSVTEITVIREGVLPGCTGVTITAIDSAGHKFQGSPENYHTTEMAAWEYIKADITQQILDIEEIIVGYSSQIKAMKAFLQEKRGAK